MNLRFAGIAFVVVTVVSVGAALFRVATAPDRIRERRDTAYAVCLRSGGQWVVVDKTEICRRPETSLSPADKREGRSTN